MTIRIILSCDGCHIDAEPCNLPHRKFNSFSGKGYGFGVWTNPGIEDVPFPEGWVPVDPYTGCTYCPKCWAEIEGEAATHDKSHDNSEVSQ